MELKQFRINNFRSIIDTGWCPFSRDGITVLVGQNESGKTSVLEALATTFSNRTITADDLRSGEPLPKMYIRLECDFTELEKELVGFESASIQIAQDYWKQQKNQLTVEFTWEYDPLSKDEPYVGNCTLYDADDLEQRLAASSKNRTADQQLAELANGPVKPLTIEHLGIAIYRAGPSFVLFNERTGMLPNAIDLDEKSSPVGNGARAARNYLTAAGIDLPKLLSSDLRTRESVLTRANAGLTSSFNSFWSQTIGNETKLSLHCSIQFYDNSNGDKAGKPHLVFWISDGHTRLYPNQRSKGVRWFVSFFLQLRAAQNSFRSTAFLLDEPGANLHSKAQSDVLKLINTLRETIPIVYSTHSPDLIEYEHLHRIHAVQRTGDADDSPTTILDAHKLGAASSDTLSPILAAMGTNLSNQQIIQKRNNVLVEEVSGFYYLKAFWKLTSEPQMAHFIASTGVNKLTTLANLFLGWGLDFITVVDDEPQGRGVLKDLTQNLYGGNAEIANRHIVKLKGCDGIEDVFSSVDFKRHVLANESAEIPGKNTEFLKKAGRSKPILALEFKLAVDSGRLQLADLDNESQTRIKTFVKDIAERLNPLAESN